MIVRDSLHATMSIVGWDVVAMAQHDEGTCLIVHKPSGKDEGTYMVVTTDEGGSDLDAQGKLTMLLNANCCQLLGAFVYNSPGVAPFQTHEAYTAAMHSMQGHVLGHSDALKGRDA